MSDSRFLLFLSDVEGNLTALRQTLQRVCTPRDVTLPELAWAEEPALNDIGWRVAEVRMTADPRSSCLVDHLEAVTEALAQDFRDRAIGLFTDRANAYGRVSTSIPGKPAKLLEGELADVLRRTSQWLDVETGVLARMVGGSERNQLSASVDFGSEAPADAALTAGPPEPDEDDRYVQAKLSEARALMARYLETRKL